MALLDEKTRSEYLKELGFGSIKALQAAYMYPKYVDGKYGQQTDNLLRTAINVKRYTKNFSPKEFRCECGGKYCCGYPDYMKPEVLKNIQAIRDHWNRPITVTCGLRDKTYNSKLGGSIQNSLHLKGKAIDFYQKGVTDTLANRKSSIKWIKTLPNHHYTYGNGINSYGNKVSAPYMGNALHTDTNDAPKPIEVKKLSVDGVGGKSTVAALQKFLKTPIDGIISGQKSSLKKYYPALTAVQFGGKGSSCVSALQRWCGAKADGIWGEGTSAKLQDKLKAEGYYKGARDGKFGKTSMKALQKYLNDKLFPSPTPTPPTPTPTPTKKGYTGEYPNTTVKTTVAANRGAEIVAKAKEYCWPKGTAKSKYSYSKGSAKAAYKTALKKYMGKSAKISQTDCGYFANTCVRAVTGNKFTALPANKSKPYPSVPSDMQIVHTGAIGSFTLLPGDVVRYRKSSGQHVIVIVNSTDIAEANRKNCFPHIEASKPYNGSNVIKSTIQVIRTKGSSKVVTRSYLEKGDKGDEVKKLQQYLNWFGNYGLKTDGVWGDATQKAVLDMQKKLGVTADGLVGANTIAAMKKVER